MDDLLEVGLLVAFGMIGFSFLLIIPGIRSFEVKYIYIYIYIEREEGDREEGMGVHVMERAEK